MGLHCVHRVYMFVMLTQAGPPHCYALFSYPVIGASLSEPHTSMTSLRMRVRIYACLDRPLTVNFE